MGRRRAGRAGLGRERARRRRLEERAQEIERSRSLDSEDLNSPSGSVTAAGQERARLPGWPSAAIPPRTTLHLHCEWCSAEIPLKARGPLPRWCSPTCRHRAWQRSRAFQALESGESASAQSPVALPIDTAGWVDLLHALSVELARARLDRTAIACALEEVRAELISVGLACP
jgi:hypothetical protein